MDKTKLIEILNSDIRDYRNRSPIVNAIIQNTTLIPVLLDKISEITNKKSDFAARILELTCKKDLKLLLPHLDLFVKIIPTLKLEGSIRASAKIIELLTIEYFIQLNPIYIEKLNIKHLEQFTESCFDWMIADSPTAIQAHSMYSLYLLGSKYDWIHLELVQIIEKYLPNGSVGYQNRGEKVIQAISTNKLFKL